MNCISFALEIYGQKALRKCKRTSGPQLQQKSRSSNFCGVQKLIDMYKICVQQKDEKRTTSIFAIREKCQPTTAVKDERKRGETRNKGLYEYNIYENVLYEYIHPDRLTTTTKQK